MEKIPKEIVNHIFKLAMYDLDVCMITKISSTCKEWRCTIIDLLSKDLSHNRIELNKHCCSQILSVLSIMKLSEVMELVNTAKLSAFQISKFITYIVTIYLPKDCANLVCNLTRMDEKLPQVIAQNISDAYCSDLRPDSYIYWERILEEMIATKGNDNITAIVSSSLSKLSSLCSIGEPDPYKHHLESISRSMSKLSDLDAVYIFKQMIVKEKALKSARFVKYLLTEATTNQVKSIIEFTIDMNEEIVKDIIPQVKRRISFANISNERNQKLAKIIDTYERSYADSVIF